MNCDSGETVALALTQQTQKDTLVSVASCADSSSELRPPSSQQLPAGCFPRNSVGFHATSTAGIAVPLVTQRLKSTRVRDSAYGIPRPPQRWCHRHYLDVDAGRRNLWS